MHRCSRTTLTASTIPPESVRTHLQRAELYMELAPVGGCHAQYLDGVAIMGYTYYRQRCTHMQEGVCSWKTRPAPGLQ